MPAASHPSRTRRRAVGAFEPSPAVVRAELARVLSAPSFAGAKGQQRLLRHLVEHTLDGATATLKETVLGIEVFGRPADRFDPTADSIVRVEARRLRQRLTRHYASNGRDAPVEITLPVGGYVPEFKERAGRGAPADPAALAPSLATSPGAPLSPADERRAQAVELVDRGTFFMRQGSEEGLRKALRRFGEAAAIDPTLPSAHMGVARTWQGLVGMIFEPPQPGLQLSREAAARVLELDPTRGDALALLASVAQRFDLDWPLAQRLYRQAIELSPGSVYLRHALAFGLMVAGRFDAASVELQAARAVEPLDLSLRAHEALLHLYRREWATAERHLKALLDLSPESLLGRTLLGSVHLCRGEGAAALALYGAVTEEMPHLSIGWVGVAQAQAVMGEPEASRATVAALEQRFEGRYLSPYQLALVATRLGDHPRAMVLLDEAGVGRDCNFFCAGVDPGLDALRADPAFARLLARHGLA